MNEDFGETIRKTFEDLRTAMSNITLSDEWKQLVEAINLFSIPHIVPQRLTGACLGGFEGVTDMDIPIEVIFSRVQNITICTIILWPDDPSICTDFSGIATLNPKDEQDDQDYANRLAFKRATRKAQEHFTIQTLNLVKTRDLYSWYRLQLRVKEKIADREVKDEIPY